MRISWFRSSCRCLRLPSDSATTTVKNLTAPLASLNQEQLKRNRMEEEVTFNDLWLTCTLGGGTGGPGGHGDTFQ